MSLKGELKEAAGFAKEEANGHGKTPKSRRKARKVATCGARVGSKKVRHRRPLPARRERAVAESVAFRVLKSAKDRNISGHGFVAYS